MMHNPPYALDQTVIEERKFQNILKDTYSRLNGLESRLRESIANTIEKFIKDPTDAISWRAELVVADQVTLSVLTEIRILINKSETVEAVKQEFSIFVNRYRSQIVSWASSGENSSSAESNLASRASLAATAKMFSSWGLANEIERAIQSDIEETKKRVVVLEFVNLKVDETFRLSPDTSTMLFRKLSPRKAVECVYPVNAATKRTVETRTKVYLFRVPLESDVLYEDNGVVAA